MSQSSNDSFPTAMHITAARGVINHLIPAPRESRASQKPLARYVAKMTKLPFTGAADKFEGLPSNDAYVFVHGAINSVTTDLFKIPTRTSPSWHIV